ncbi:MAG: DUF1810 domain-containing protein [Rhodobacteraceae bacterium]|nr:DUF1810 domain-containing protein [Paracoccaceae bacterium]
MNTDFDLGRFVAAQANTYETALAEISSGQKRSHWMWFIFPQLRDLGRSPTALHYGLAGVKEAQAYLAHPVLGPRLRDCCTALLAIRGRSAHQVFGTPDDLKLRSSMTLFAIAAEDSGLFLKVLETYCDGQLDPLTHNMIAG